MLNTHHNPDYDQQFPIFTKAFTSVEIERHREHHDAEINYDFYLDEGSNVSYSVCGVQRMSPDSLGQGVMLLFPTVNCDVYLVTNGRRCFFVTKDFLIAQSNSPAEDLLACNDYEGQPWNYEGQPWSLLKKSKPEPQQQLKQLNSNELVVCHKVEITETALRIGALDTRIRELERQIAHNQGQFGGNKSVSGLLAALIVVLIKQILKFQSSHRYQDLKKQIKALKDQGQDLKKQVKALKRKVKKLEK